MSAAAVFCRLLAVVVMLVLAVFAGTSDATAIMNRPQRNDVSMADAIKYLQELDNYYSQISRPSLPDESVFLEDGQKPMFPSTHRGNKRYKDFVDAMRLMRLRTIDRLYAPHSRPRFGKRNNPLSLLRNQENEVDSEDIDWKAKLFNRRR